MSPGLALWLAVSFLAYCGLGGWVRSKGARVMLALLWPLGLAYIVMSQAAEDIRRMVK